MTHVILTNGSDEMHIEFPAVESFTEYLAKVRSIVPDRRWQISEAWDC